MEFASGRNAAKQLCRAPQKATRAQVEPPPKFSARPASSSLLPCSGAGVDSLVAERVVGHKQGGVAVVYDRRGFNAEKRDALERLAELVEPILQPPRDSVISIPKASRFARLIRPADSPRRQDDSPATRRDVK